MLRKGVSTGSLVMESLLPAEARPRGLRPLIVRVAPLLLRVDVTLGDTSDHSSIDRLSSSSVGIRPELWSDDTVRPPLPFLEVVLRISRGPDGETFLLVLFFDIARGCGASGELDLLTNGSEVSASQPSIRVPCCRGRLGSMEVDIGFCRESDGVLLLSFDDLR